MSVVIRRAQAADAREIAVLSLKLVRQHHDYDPSRFSSPADLGGMAAYYGSQTTAEGSAVIVAEIDTIIAGFAFVQYEAINYADLLESAAWLHDLYVDQTVRGTNIGKRLIEASVEAAREMGANKLMLSVAAKNDFGRDFFQRSGFRPTMIEMTMNLK